MCNGANLVDFWIVKVVFLIACKRYFIFYGIEIAISLSQLDGLYRVLSRRIQYVCNLSIFYAYLCLPGCVCIVSLSLSARHRAAGV